MYNTSKIIEKHRYRITDRKLNGFVKK